MNEIKNYANKKIVAQVIITQIRKTQVHSYNNAMNNEQLPNYSLL